MGVSLSTAERQTSLKGTLLECPELSLAGQGLTYKAKYQKCKQKEG